MQSNYSSIGYFSEVVSADNRRKEFDIKNQSIMRKNITPDFLFIGDSITHFWELPAYFNTSKKLIINRGIAGDTSTYLNKRFESDALRLSPKYCIIGIGTNDSILLEGDYWKLIQPTPISEVLSNAQNNILDVIRKGQKTSTQLIFTSLLPINIPILQYEPKRKQFICEFNEWLERTCAKEKCVFVNYYKATTFPGTNKPLDNILLDGLHPNAVGYEIMSLLLRNTLNKYEIEI